MAAGSSAFASLRAAVQVGNKQVYDNSDDGGFLNLRKMDTFVGGPDKSQHYYENDIRLLVKPGTEGYAYRIIHQQVGRPPNTKVMTCPKCVVQNPDQVPCSVCELLALVGQNAELGGRMMDFPERVDGGKIAIKQKSMAAIVKDMAPTHLLLFSVVEPRFFGQEAYKANPEYKIQKFWANKRTITKGFFDLIGQ